VTQTTDGIGLGLRDISTHPLIWAHNSSFVGDFSGAKTNAEALSKDAD